MCEDEIMVTSSIISSLCSLSPSLVNRRATRFITARKTIANVNLRGVYILVSSVEISLI